MAAAQTAELASSCPTTVRHGACKFIYGVLDPEYLNENTIFRELSLMAFIFVA